MRAILQKNIIFRIKFNYFSYINVQSFQLEFKTLRDNQVRNLSILVI